MDEAAPSEGVGRGSFFRGIGGGRGRLAFFGRLSFNGRFPERGAEGMAFGGIVLGAVPTDGVDLGLEELILVEGDGNVSAEGWVEANGVE